MTRGHAESTIKTTNGKVSVALTAENMIVCLMLVCLAELCSSCSGLWSYCSTHSQLPFQRMKTACQTQKNDSLGSADECSQVSTSRDRQHGKWLKFDCLALGGGWQAGSGGLGHG